MINNNFHLKDKGVSDASGTTDLPRYRWYTYKEGFSPEVVQTAIENSGVTKDDLIFDPFNGSGTVTLHASKLGYKSTGIEVNPFAHFLSQVKLFNPPQNYLDKKFSDDINITVDGIIRAKKSPLLYYSTFSEKSGKDKWLFNSSVLNAFEGGMNTLLNVNPSAQQLIKFALIKSAMDNCNAQKDGKCLRYYNKWKKFGFNQENFLDSFIQLTDIIKDDLKENLLSKAALHKGDSRRLIKKHKDQFKLCITSPPYLNSFDYNDVYRPEMFLGNFVRSSEQLKSLRKKAISSHINVSNSKHTENKHGLIYQKILKEIISEQEILWNPKIITMVRSYFDDMESVLKDLFHLGENDSQLWLVVANSAYANIEIPTDLILGEIASKVGWKLKEIGVLRNLLKRGSKYSPDIKTLRESVVILSK